jgi:hypothetical protein
LTRPNHAVFRWLDDAESKVMSALIEVYKEMHETGREPGAEHWSTNESGRATIDMKVRAAWSRRPPNFPEYNFPYTRDTVVAMWICYRKVSEQEKKYLETWAAGGSPGLF